MRERDASRLPAPCTANIACDGWTEPRHDIVIHEDWTVTTPHDLEADRVAAAFGGNRHTCMDLKDDLFAAELAFGAVTRSAPRQYALRMSPLEPSSLDFRYVRSRTAVDILCALLRQVGDGTDAAGTRAVATQFLAEADGVDILWDDGTPARYAVAWWYSLGRPAGRVPAFDVLRALSRPDLPTPAFTVGEPPVPTPMGGLTSQFVVPGIVRTVLRSPAFLTVFDGIEAAPEPDHDQSSQVPGCSKWNEDLTVFRPGPSDRTWTASLLGARSGSRFIQAVFDDGRRALRIRTESSPTPLTVPIADQRPGTVNPVDPDDPLYRLSLAMLTAVRRGQHGRHQQTLNKFARYLHGTGEYRETVLWLLYAYRTLMPPWPVRIVLVLYGLTLRGYFDADDPAQVVDITGKHLLRSAPDAFGLPLEFTDRTIISLHPTRADLDLRALERRTRVWLRSIFREMSPTDGGAALLDAATLLRRPYDLVCTWGPDTATFQFSRVGSGGQEWGAPVTPTPRMHLINVAYLLAYADVTGSAEILPPVPGDSSRPAVRARYLRSVLSINELRRLTSREFPASW